MTTGRRPPHGFEPNESDYGQEVRSSTRHMSSSRESSTLNQAMIAIHVLETKVDRIEQMLGELVTKVEFWPVRMIAYGLASTILFAALTAILSFVFIRK